MTTVACYLFFFATTQAVKMRDNEVHLDNSGSVDFNEKGHSVSSGQPWGGVRNNYAGLTVRAGRKGKDGPARFFLEDLGPANIIGNSVQSDRTPEKLNFAISGDLTMNVDSVRVTCNNIRFGQGHTGSTNNWWMGGPDCVGGNSVRDPIICACRDGALVQFKTGNVNRFSVSLTNRCGIIGQRYGAWSPVTAAPGQKIGYSFTSSTSEYTETDFMVSLTAKYSAPLTFGDLEISAESSYTYVTQNTRSSSWSQTCEVTVPEGSRLWQWTYAVETNCGHAALHSCYFFTLPIDEGAPCCLAGYQSSDPKQCTEDGKNMCA